MTQRKSTTRKKNRVIGKQTYINQATGELVDMNVVESEDVDFNFEKIWLGHILQALDCVGNKKIKVMSYLLENRNSKNQIIATQRVISSKTGVSLPVVSETIKIMQDANVITMEQQGVYMLNPDVIFKGDKDRRLSVLIRYNKLKADE